MALQFVDRHIGPSPSATAEMLGAIGYESLDALVDAAVPGSIRMKNDLDLPSTLSEKDALRRLKREMSANEPGRALIGEGYYGTVIPSVIQRNILENPGWYTAYTPYQAEIAQGRLEMLLNFQTLISDLTGLPVANASLLDEGTAAAEAISMALGARPKATKVFVSHHCWRATIDVILTRMTPLDIEVVIGDESNWEPDNSYAAALLQYPGSDGVIRDYSALTKKLREKEILVIAAADPLALVLLQPPGQWGSDIAIGNTQRFGVPYGFGGPHAAYIACSEPLKRRLPGRLVGVSVDADGKSAYRLSLQTREQHIRRDKATSNICTAQVLLAVLAAAYAVYHGPDGLRSIAARIRDLTARLGEALTKDSDWECLPGPWFDTLVFRSKSRSAQEVIESAAAIGLHLRSVEGDWIGLSFDELTSDDELATVAQLLWITVPEKSVGWIDGLERQDPILEHPVFHRYHTETEMLRYLHRLESKDLALNESMIPLGSCTMKLNAASEMMPLSWPTVSDMHPFIPAEYALGYTHLIDELETWLGEITGFPAVSLQPNAGSQGEFAGLLAIRRFLDAQDDGTQRNICLIPNSAHGTNPASAVMAGFKVVPVKCDDSGNIDVAHLRSLAQKHSTEIGALMITYPSTHGVFETAVSEICKIVHKAGGQVYLDGANMNAQVGLCRPGDYGADVCHLNLHKTFAIPHGGGGPGVGPVCAAAHLAPYMPGHYQLGETQCNGAVCSAPHGSASILTISWMYLAMMSAHGLRRAAATAILNANYIAHRLGSAFPVLYKGSNGLVAHECIIDLRDWKERANIEVEDVAKRLMDYGFHAPTMSWPVAGTLMIEPTESESKGELDRFCDALLSIHAEMSRIETGDCHSTNNLLKNAPHTAQCVCSDRWDRPYSREEAAFPNRETRAHKFWPASARIDNVHGDRNLVCTCPPLSAYSEPENTES